MYWDYLQGSSCLGGCVCCDPWQELKRNSACNSLHSLQDKMNPFYILAHTCVSSLSALLSAFLACTGPFSPLSDSCIAPCHMLGGMRVFSLSSLPSHPSFAPFYILVWICSSPLAALLSSIENLFRLIPHLLIPCLLQPAYILNWYNCTVAIAGSFHELHECALIISASYAGMVCVMHCYRAMNL